MNASDTLTTSQVNDLEDRRYAAMVEPISTRSTSS